MKHRHFLPGLLALALCSGALQAQNVNYARMAEDVRYLDERVTRLNAQVENLQRQNDQLMQAVQLLINQQNELTTSYNTFVQTTRTSLASLNNARQEDKAMIIAEVTRQIQALGAQTEKAINQVASAPATPAQPNIQNLPQSFSNDYPQTGVAHVVKAGDTLSGIARQYGSTVRDIQNANHISRPQQLLAGATIFVPVRQKD